jgi:hypothetical protein
MRLVDDASMITDVYDLMAIKSAAIDSKAWTRSIKSMADEYWRLGDDASSEKLKRIAEKFSEIQDLLEELQQADANRFLDR